jgi:excisionase family DNA binding protein
MTLERTDDAADRPLAGRQRRKLRGVALLGVTELAEQLGTSERFVRRLVCERRVRFHKVGKFVRFDPRDIDAWLAEHRIDSVS